MKSVITIAVSMLLSGCLATVPVSRKFPDVPSVLETPCESLKLVPETDKLSETLVTITENYTLYHECSLKVDIWMTWYQEQKKIFESVK